jgi:hypothetical protein
MTRYLINGKILNFIFLFSTVLIFGQNYGLEDFETDSVPTQETQYKWHNSKIHWIIEKKNDSIKIRQNDYNHFKGDSLPFSQKQIAKKIKSIYSIRAVKKVSDGYIVGLNGGEFGGGLWFISKNGKKSYEISSYIRVRQIFEFNNKLYVIRGLAHLGSSYGSLFELKKDTKWKVFKDFQLPDAPEFLIMEDENILILTTDRLMSFDKNEKLVEILKAPFYWGMYYPSSAIVDCDNIYIAMRKGILKISEFKSNQNFEWLVKK